MQKQLVSLSIIWFVIFLTVPTITFGQEEIKCGYSDEEDLSARMENMSNKSATDTVQIKVILVDFHNNPNVSIDETTLDNLWGEFTTNLFDLSRGEHIVNVEIVANPDTTDRLWTADYDSDVYGNIDLTNNIARYQQYWVGRQSTKYRGELQAEIFLKIQMAYSSEPSPFDGTDVIIFVYVPAMEENAIEWGLGGEGTLHVKKDMFPVLEGAAYDPTDISSTNPQGQWRPFGVICNWFGGGVEYEWTTASIIMHEYGHLLGIHHPSSFNADVQSCSPLQEGMDSYYHGPYNLMRRILLGGRPFQPFHERDLLKLGWLDRVQVNNNLRDVIIKDIRLGGSVFYIADFDTVTLTHFIPFLFTESFSIALHAGNGLDAKSVPAGGNMYLSEGLAIWHHHEYIHQDFPDIRNEVIMDLESGWGLFSDPEIWQEGDSISGFDNLDTWYDRVLGCATRNAGEAVNYVGDSNDFFSGPGAEFSYRTNPSTAGYSNDTVPIPDPIGRYLIQNEINSIVIRIKEDYGDSILVDILLAPYEDVITPNGGEIIAAGEECHISWEKEFTIDQEGGIIDFVDIYFNPGPGQSDVLIDTGVEATDGQYTWIPTSADISSEGKIKIVYNNINDSGHVGEDESDGTFEIVPAPIATFSDVSSQTGLSFGGTPYGSTALDYNGDGKKDLFVSISDSRSSLNNLQQLSPNGVPLFSSYANEFTDLTQAYRGVTTADYDNDGDQDLFLSHGSQSKLFSNNNGIFADASATLGLGTLVDQSTSACWGDFDRDGWLDLYVVRAETYSDPPLVTNGGPQHRLFRNEVSSGGGFVDVTSSAGLDGVAIFGSLSASWVDFDQDGDQDLFVANNQLIPGGQGEVNCLLFVNQDDGTFLEQYDSIIGAQLPSVTSARWADMDNDTDLDLLISGDDYEPIIFLNDGVAGFLAQTPLRIDSNEGHSGLTVFDHDLDGRSDVLLLSNDDQASSRFFSNQEVSGNLAFVENTTNVGLTDLGRVLGSVATDFTNDGDPDLFLGKPLSGGKYFFKTETTGGSDPLGRNYVKVLLSSPDGANNRSGIGAIVTVTAGTLIQTQMVDGGSGRGAQNDRELTFGLGSYSSTVTATIQWPGGHVQSDVPLVISDQSSETINAILDDTAPVVSNVSANSVFNPSTGKLDWTFAWETDVSCDPSLDKLTFDQAGISNPCWPGWTTVTPATAGVSHTYKAKPGGGYTHEFKLFNIDCITKCSFRYYVTSGVGSYLNSCSPILKGVKVCPTVP